jgi:subtilisin family serine protease
MSKSLDVRVPQIGAPTAWQAGHTGKGVNMSLGGGESDGTDPVSLAVNQLSKSHGALFVVAAGNSGTREKVSAPASADAALAVGSLVKSGAVSDFSSRGPRLGGHCPQRSVRSGRSTRRSGSSGRTTRRCRC